MIEPWNAPANMIPLTSAQEESLNDSGRFCVLAGGRRFGKTTAACLKLRSEALSHFFLTYFHVSPSHRMAICAWERFLEVLNDESGWTANKDSLTFFCASSGSTVRFVSRPESVKSVDKRIGGIAIDEPWLSPWLSESRRSVQRLTALCWENDGCWLLLTGTPPRRKWLKRLRLLARLMVGKAGFDKDSVSCYTKSSLSGSNITQASLDEARAALSPEAFEAEFMTEYD